MEESSPSPPSSGFSEDIHFVTNDDLKVPSTLKMTTGGLLNPDGTINWDCPCLDGFPKSPCGEQFKVALSCLFASTAEPFGSDCVEVFQKFEECMKEHPELLPPDEKSN